MLPQIYRTVILEDQFFDQEAIRAILRTIPEVQIIGMETTTQSALDLCRAKKPDLIIVDAQIYDDKFAGVNFVKTVRKILPQARILGMTRWSECLDPLRRAGCDFAVNKGMIENEASALKFLKETVLPRPEHYVGVIPPTLTEIEDQVLKAICAGKTEDEIALDLDFPTRKPIRKIKNTLFQKFNALNVAQLVHLAHLSGYLNSEEN